MSDRDDYAPKEPQHFQTTHWSLIVRVQSGGETESRGALEQLCATYWYPVYAFVRRAGRNAHDAQDLTQDFFAHLMERAALDHVDRDRGKFRSFLLASLNNFLANDWDRRNALKRGGGRTIVSIDEELAEERFHHEPATDLSPDKFFDRQWAITVLERAIDRLAGEMRANGREQQFEKLREFLAVRAPQSAYNDLAAELRTTAAALSITVSRMRQRYRDLIRSEVSDTLLNLEDADTEIRHLLAAMA